MADTKDLVLKRTMAAVDSYSESVPARLALSLVPTIGPFLDLALSTLGTNVFQARVKAFADAVKEEIGSVREDMLRKDFLESEEWVSVVHRAIDASARTSSREMITHYAALLVNAATHEEPASPPPDLLISTLAELSPIEVSLARVIWSDGKSINYDEGQPPYRVHVAPGSWEKVSQQFPDAARPNLIFHLKRLERSGLISEITGTYGGATMYGPTPTLGRIIRALRGAEE